MSQVGTKERPLWLHPVIPAGNPGERVRETAPRLPCARRAGSHYRSGGASSIRTWTYSEPAPRSGRGIASDAVSDGLDTAKLLDIDMDQLAWIAHHWAPWVRAPRAYRAPDGTEPCATVKIGMSSGRAIAGPLSAAADGRSRRSARQRCGSCGARGRRAAVSQSRRTAQRQQASQWWARLVGSPAA
jgi:hypothetical protein